MKRVDVAIIGAGTAGLTARREVMKKTDNYVVIDDGPLGTTCARVGCMPSKTLIQVARDFSRRSRLQEQGIHNGMQLTVDTTEVMVHVRKLRDRFVKGVHSSMAGWRDEKLIRKPAHFVDMHTLDLGDEKIWADTIIIAVGTRPVIPSSWQEFQSFIINTDALFELKKLPLSMAVFGIGVIGLELGQALSQLGVRTTIIGRRAHFAGITDPELNNYIARKFSEQLDLSLNGFEITGRDSDGLLRLKTGEREIAVERVLMALGRRPNLDRLNLPLLNLPVDKRGIPCYQEETFRIQDTNLFLVGDTNLRRPLLHEAADQGRIAGFNAVNDSQCFKERTPLAITFCEPNIATVGKRHQELLDQDVDFVTGKASFEKQGRSIIKLEEIGALHIYADRATGKLLGAELFAPDGEHLAHLISWAISCDLTVHETLALPFYHPVIEEGLRTAIRNAARQVEVPANLLEVLCCEDSLTC
ncbi:MAG: dihydrolipoyl dehydrogenase [Deltaproteobacteria bacterium]|nr:dihydrolipoyl dehydrogenase [Deltaproteobacteria bacterium]